jgi:hypothetical protein
MIDKTNFQKVLKKLAFTSDMAGVGQSRLTMARFR